MALETTPAEDAIINDRNALMDRTGWLEWPEGITEEDKPIVNQLIDDARDAVLKELPVGLGHWNYEATFDSALQEMGGAILGAYVRAVQTTEERIMKATSILAKQQEKNNG